MTQFTDAGIKATVAAQVTEGEAAMSDEDRAPGEPVEGSLTGPDAEAGADGTIEIASPSVQDEADEVESDAGAVVEGVEVNDPEAEAVNDPDAPHLLGAGDAGQAEYSTDHGLGWASFPEDAEAEAEEAPEADEEEEGEEEV